ncbi:MAG: F0F1 ATP synthase subunit A [Candidatus Brocadiia bacterium]
MEITPDKMMQVPVGPVTLNATIFFTWGVMAILAVGSWLITRTLSTGTEMSRWHNGLEVVVNGMRNQIREVSQQAPDQYLPFVGTLFLFIATCNLLTIVPGYQPPTGSLSTTAALALCVFVAVPFYGISEKGVVGYLKTYARPSVFMLPFNVIGELSRTLALAVRLFGNVMSGTVIVGVLLMIAPLLVPDLMQMLGLLVGMIHAYIFALLAMVYIASATRASAQRRRAQEEKEGQEKDEEREEGAPQHPSSGDREPGGEAPPRPSQEGDVSSG